MRCCKFPNQGLFGSKDLEFVGSGDPRILESYSKECLRFIDNFTMMTFPASEKLTEQVIEQVLKLLSKVDQNEYTTTELMNLADIKHRPTFLYNYLQPALDAELIEITIPEKPKSSKQRYRLTVKGKQFQTTN